MPYRATKEKSAARAKAQELYVKDGLSLEEIRQRTRTPLKTLRAWRNLGRWEAMRKLAARTELDRLKDLQNHLLDRAEAQIKEGKLPHTEIGLMYKLESMIGRREQKQELPKTLVLDALKRFGPRVVQTRLGPRLLQTDSELYHTFKGILLELGTSISEQDFPRSPQ